MNSLKVADVLLAAALIGGAFFLHMYLGIAALAALTAALFSSMHDVFLRNKGIIGRFPSIITVALVVIIFLIPVVTIIGLSLSEAHTVASNLSNSVSSNKQQTDELTYQTAVALGSIGVPVSPEAVSAKYSEVVKTVIPTFLGLITRATENIVALITDFIVYTMLLWTILNRKHKIIKLVKKLSPLDDTINDEYLRIMRAMSVSMVKGTLLISVLAGFFVALTLWITGFHYFLFSFLLFAFLSFLPFGAGILFIPIGIGMLLLGNLWEGLLVLLVQFLILNNLDNVLRPLLAPKEHRMPGALLLLSTFAGVSYFGLVGVVYGPIIMIVVYTTIQIYIRHSSTGIPLKFRDDANPA